MKKSFLTLFFGSFLLLGMICGANEVTFAQSIIVEYESPSHLFYPLKMFSSEADSIYHKGWIDLNKNGEEDPYENPNLPITKRINDLINRMNLKEKTAQMVTLDWRGKYLKDSLPTPEWKRKPWKDGIGDATKPFNGVGKKKSSLAWPPSRHAKALNTIQRFFIEKTRLGIPVDFTAEGIRGLQQKKATSFPVEIGQGATWDPKLINMIGHTEGREARALGYTNVWAPEMDVGQDPRWGRVLATYGESPFLDSKFGIAMVTGLQAEGVASTVKHFAVYSIPAGGRDGDSRDHPHAAPREVHTVFLPSFKAAVKAGALGVMSSYNDYNGMVITGSHYFLTKILREKWGFKGYIVSDSHAIGYIYDKFHIVPNFKGAVKLAVKAGVDVRLDAPSPPLKYLNPLRDLVKSEQISMETINKRVRDVLRIKFLLGLFDRPYVKVKKTAKRVRTPASLNLSLKTAKESIVLLKNKDNILPLDKDKIHSILVTGASATDTALVSKIRYGPTDVPATSILKNIRAKVNPGTKVTYVKGVNITDVNFPESDVIAIPPPQSVKNNIAHAVEVAKKSDVAIVVIGGNTRTIGEGRSKVSLNPPGYQLALVKAIYKTGIPVILILRTGRPLSINWSKKHIPGILEAWFPGEKGGEAIADVLFGDYDPGGKLPITFPKSAGQVPLAFPYWPVSHDQSEATELPQHARVAGVLYPFGYGLSYTSFKYSNLQIDPESQRKDQEIKISLNVKNTGDQKGDEVVQLYLHEQTAPVVRPVKKLRGFKRITLKPGQTKKVSFTLTPRDLEIYDLQRHWRVVPGIFQVMVGSSSLDIRLTGSFKIKQ